MGLQSEILADFAEIEADVPCTFARGTDSGPCVVSTFNAGTDLIVGGKLATIKATMFVRCDLFATAPLARQPVTVTKGTDAAVEYRIAEVRTDAVAGHYELPLMGLDEL